MIILTIRTDKPESEIGLFKDGSKLAYRTWLAHRQLAETIHEQIRQLLMDCGLDWPAIGAVLMYEGPGSFTGLRIGISTGNVLAYAYNIPVLGSGGEKWLEDGLAKIKNYEAGQYVLPLYGSEPHITEPKK